MVGTKGQLNVTIVKKQTKTKKTQSYHSDGLTLPMLLMANLANTKWCKNHEK